LVRGDRISIGLQEGGDKLPEDLGYFEPRLDHGVDPSFAGDTWLGLSAVPAESPGLGLSPGSSRLSSGLRVAVTLVSET
jgi:hypothetical protein